MIKLREILRLYYECKFSHRKIAISCNVSSSTVSDYLARTKAIDLSWPIPANITDSDIEELLFPKNKHLITGKPLPDWEVVSKELQKKGVTKQLLWEEYIEVNPDGIGYSRFCDLYRTFLNNNQEVSMRISHKAGEKLYVDYAGQTVDIHTENGVIAAAIFVATFGASNYSYVEATTSQSSKDWLLSHVRAFKFFGGCPEVLVPDNLKSGVTKACYYEPIINETYRELAEHYGIAVIPARKRRPKDKAKVETSVKIASMWILARIRHEKFFTLYELNQRIRELLLRFNQRDFQKIQGNREQMFLEVDKPALKSLPADDFKYSEKKLARVNIDYHIEYKGHYYSVPYTFAKKQVKLLIAEHTLEIFHENQRIASHVLSVKKGSSTTIDDHMPPKHQKYKEWNPERISKWAESIGPATCELIKRIMKSRKYPEQGFRSSLGIIRLEKKFGAQRLEQACLRALNYNALSYKSVKSMLESGFDTIPVSSNKKQQSIHHENIRGQTILN